MSAESSPRYQAAPRRLMPVAVAALSILVATLIGLVVAHFVAAQAASPETLLTAPFRWQLLAGAA